MCTAGHHVHGLPTGGQAAMEELLPGLTEEMLKLGAPVGDLLGNVRWILNGHRTTQVDSGLPAVSASRPLLEGHVRPASGRWRMCPLWSVVRP